ncbi:MAG: hypothetical protein AAGI15_05250 [Pseudomonadota bacterium]
MTNTKAIAAQAALHHQYFLGLQLMVAVEAGKDAVYEWMFRLFRRQHEEKFLSSFEKLGLAELPHAVACAQYHVLSNSMGGVAVEYMPESDRKAWVRFRYPRWMYAGPAICGIPVEASRGFLHGWYAQNGVSLKNPRLGFVCVSEDVTGQFGLCGYFREYEHELGDDERLVFAPDEPVPGYDPAAQPAPPAEQWSEERLAKANRNYAMEYVRNAMHALVAVIGREQAQLLAKRAARLTGLQHYPEMRASVGAVDGDADSAASFLCALMDGMGDPCERRSRSDGAIEIRQRGLRIVRGLDAADREDLLAAWVALWQGAIASQRAFLTLSCRIETDQLIWLIR